MDSEYPATTRPRLLFLQDPLTKAKFIQWDILSSVGTDTEICKRPLLLGKQEVISVGAMEPSCNRK